MANDGYTIILGNNEITNCAAALVIEGDEVFRLREDEQGELLIDCDIRNQQGERLAKIARNHVAYAAPGFEGRVQPGQPAQVVHQATGQVVAHIERLGRRRVKVNGCFCVNGAWVLATDAGIFLANSATICNTGFEGWGTAIKPDRGAFALGCVSACKRWQQCAGSCLAETT